MTTRMRFKLPIKFTVGNETQTIESSALDTTVELVAAGAYDDLKAQNDRLRTVLGYAKEKLMLYRAGHSGEYIGGIEYTALIKLIDEALR